MYSFTQYVEDCDALFPGLHVKQWVMYGDVDPTGLIKFMALKLFICDDPQLTTTTVAFKTKSLMRQLDEGYPIDWDLY